MDVTTKPGAAIATRFREEISFIEQLTGIAADIVRIDTFSLAETSERLRELNLLEPDESLFPNDVEPANFSDSVGMYAVFTHEQLEQKEPLIGALLARIQPLLEQAERDQLPLPERGDFDDPSGTLLAETVSFISDLRRDESDTSTPTRRDPVELTAYREDLRRSLASYEDDSPPTGAALANADKLVSHAEEIVEFNIRRSRYSTLFIASADLKRLRLFIHASRPDAYVNVWRQSFISLMTAFDATVFDIVRVAFRNAFFTVLKAFAENGTGDKAKLLLKNLAEYGSFDTLRTEIAEGQLSSHYLSGLLHILKELKADGVCGGPYAHLIEMVLRRNVHMHNRGVVDQKYMEGDGRGFTGHNTENLRPNDVAVINYDYLVHAIQRCSETIDALATWADNLSDPGPAA